MGYRSDVKVLIDLSNEKPVEEIAAEIKEITKGDVFDSIKVNKKTGLILCEVDSIKWYRTYPEIEAFEKWLDEWDSYDGLNGGIHFVRVGEDLDDLEERCIGDVGCWLDIHRSIGPGDFLEDDEDEIPESSIEDEEDEVWVETK